MIASGGQGEPLAAAQRLVHGDHAGSLSTSRSAPLSIIGRMQRRSWRVKSKARQAKIFYCRRVDSDDPPSSF
jgi:hypothetical protein